MNQTMSIKDARAAYYKQYEKFRNAAAEMAKKKEEAQKQAKLSPKQADLFLSEAAVLELNYNKLNEKAEEYLDYQSKIIETECCIANAKSAEQQGEAVKKEFEELGKIMTVARRLMHGDIVPGSDERKLLEYDNDLYMACKQAQMMAQLEEKKEYESLWDEEEKPQEAEDPMETAGNTEISVADGPDLSTEVAEVVPEISAE